MWLYYKNVSVSDATLTSSCYKISFHDHGHNTKGKHVYMEFPVMEKALCHEECKNNKTCSGYTYDDDSKRCFLSNYAMFIDTLCFSCRFYEKICQPSTYSLFHIRPKTLNTTPYPVYVCDCFLIYIQLIYFKILYKTANKTMEYVYDCFLIYIQFNFLKIFI